MRNGTSTLMLSALLGTTACNGQSKPVTDAAEAGKDTPIAEYVVECFLDSKGALWFGTIEHGVARYDGKALTFLSPADGKGGNVVTSIAEDKDGIHGSRDTMAPGWCAMMENTSPNSGSMEAA
ncbi:MAG: hypothetical protein IPG74_12760 [Flavobacteriales bacterium]|nr:hypothetical protein [Flavobacteriales bacterium]